MPMASSCGRRRAARVCARLVANWLPGKGWPRTRPARSPDDGAGVRGLGTLHQPVPPHPARCAPTPTLRPFTSAILVVLRPTYYSRLHALWLRESHRSEQSVEYSITPAAYVGFPTNDREL